MILILRRLAITAYCCGLSEDLSRLRYPVDVLTGWVSVFRLLSIEPDDAELLLCSSSLHHHGAGWRAATRSVTPLSAEAIFLNCELIRCYRAHAEMGEDPFKFVSSFDYYRPNGESCTAWIGSVNVIPAVTAISTHIVCGADLAPIRCGMSWTLQASSLPDL